MTAFFFLVPLAACDDPAIERGVPPALALDTRAVTVPIYSYAAARRLRSVIHVLAQGDITSLRSVILVDNATEAGAARARLIEDGISPASIFVRRVPDNVIIVTRTTIHPMSCQAAIRPGYLGDAANSVDSLGRCVEATNLAEMLADPADLAAPTRLAPTDGAVAARAVLDWQKSATELRSPGNAGTGGNGSVGGAISSAQATSNDTNTTGPAAAGVQLAPAPVNPLLAPGF